MTDFVTSSNMNLPIPVVGEAPGPDWADLLNACLALIDSHDHSSGEGVQLTASGININTDFPMNLNNIVSIKSARFTTQVSPLSDPSDLDCIYVSGVDLYYNDGSGNKIRITESGGVAGSPGSISNLVSPASAAYVSGSATFVWQSAALTPANLDAGSVVIRNVTASSEGITLSAPVALGSSYSLVLPSLPASQKFMALDASGNISAPWYVDNSTIEFSSNLLQIKDSAISTAKIATQAVTKVKQGPVPTAAYGSDPGVGGIARSIVVGTFTGSTGANGIILNLVVTLTTTGRPVWVGLVSDDVAGLPAYLEAFQGTSPSSTSVGVDWEIRRDGTSSVAIARMLSQAATAGTPISLQMPPSILSGIDVVAAGTHTYTAYYDATTLALNSRARVLHTRLVAYEI